MRTLIPGLIALVLGALALGTGAQILHALANSPSALSDLRSSLDDAAPFHLLPVSVTGLIQEVLGRPIGPAETAAILACILFEAVVVGVAFELALADRSFGLVVNGLIALAGAWGVMHLYDFRPGVEALGDLDALVARGLVASVAAPARNVLASEAAKALTRISAAGRRRPKGPSAERIRGAAERRKS